MSRRDFNHGNFFCGKAISDTNYYSKTHCEVVRGLTGWTSLPYCTQWRHSDDTAQQIWLWTVMGGDPLLLLQVMELNSCPSALTSALLLQKTPSVHIQPQNVETWRSLKSIFNSRPSPSLAPAAVQDWPFTLVTLRPSFSFGPACMGEMVGWTLSHPHTDRSATMVSESFFKI